MHPHPNFCNLHEGRCAILEIRCGFKMSGSADSINFPKIYCLSPAGGLPFRILTSICPNARSYSSNPFPNYQHNGNPFSRMVNSFEQLITQDIYGNIIMHVSLNANFLFITFQVYRLASRSDKVIKQSAASFRYFFTVYRVYILTALVITHSRLYTATDSALHESLAIHAFRN